MSPSQLRVVGSGLSFLFIFLSGFRLGHFGKPYSVIMLTIHKLISLAAAGFVVIAVYQINQVATLSGIAMTTVVTTGLLFLSTGVTGGLLSTDKPMPAAVLRLHQITPFLTVLSTAATLYLTL